VAAALVEAVRARQAAARTVAVGAAATTPLATTAAAYVDHKDMAGWTPLHLAAQQGHSHALRTLLEAGANHAAVNQVGRFFPHPRESGFRYYYYYSLALRTGWTS